MTFPFRTAPLVEPSPVPNAILVVDDEIAFVAVVGEILELFGYEVHSAHSVRQAFQILEDLRPDLILTDVMMPDSDGLNFIRQLRASEQWTDVPIVVVSAKAVPEDLKAAREAGADGCLPKPFTAQDLRSTIQRHLNQSRPA